MPGEDWQAAQFDFASSGDDRGVSYTCRHGVGIQFVKQGEGGKVMVHRWHVEIACPHGCRIRLISPNAMRDSPVELPSGPVEIVAHD